jgi:hypothetical protein
MSNDQKKVAILLASALADLRANLLSSLEDAPRVRARSPFDVPPRGGPIHHARAGTKRALLEVIMAGRGATLETIMRRTRWDRRNALMNIRAMDRLGYGIVENAETGRIRLTLPAHELTSPVWA